MPVVSAVGAMRRLQALAVLGHSVHTVEKVSKVKSSTLYKIRIGAHPRIEQATADAIARAYPVVLVRPVGRQAWVSQRAARAQGWRGPGAWPGGLIDEPEAVPVEEPHP